MNKTKTESTERKNSHGGNITTKCAQQNTQCWSIDVTISFASNWIYI